MVTSSKFADGWQSSTLDVRGTAEDVVIAPDGIRYVAAKDNERADLVCDHLPIYQDILVDGMATVYVAEDLKRKRKVAVKVVRPEREDPQ